MTGVTTQQADLFIPQGADWEYDFSIDEAIDLVGATAAMQMRTKDGATYVATLSTADGTLILDPDNNIITAAMPHGTSAALVPLEYVYDLLISTASNAYYRAYEGNAIVDGRVTLASVLPPTSNIPISTEDGLNITTESGERIAT